MSFTFSEFGTSNDKTLFKRLGLKVGVTNICSPGFMTRNTKELVHERLLVTVILDSLSECREHVFVMSIEQMDRSSTRRRHRRRRRRQQQKTDFGA